MTKLKKAQMKRLEELKQKALDSMQELESYLTEVEKEVNSYSVNRSDAWYNSDSCDSHYDWENKLDLKSTQLSEIKTDFSKISFEDISSRDKEELPIDKESLFDLLFRNKREMSILARDQDLIIKKMKEAI